MRGGTRAAEARATSVLALESQASQRSGKLEPWHSSREQQADFVAWQWGVVLAVREFLDGEWGVGANLLGHEIVSDSSSGAVDH